VDENQPAVADAVTFPQPAESVLLERRDHGMTRKTDRAAASDNPTYRARRPATWQVREIGLPTTKKRATSRILQALFMRHANACLLCAITSNPRSGNCKSFESSGGASNHQSIHGFKAPPKFSSVRPRFRNRLKHLNLWGNAQIFLERLTMF